MKQNILIFTRSDNNFITGGEKYNYYIFNSLIKKQKYNIKFELMENKLKCIQRNRLLLNSLLPFYFLIKYLFLKDNIILQFDSDRIICLLLNLYNRFTKRNKLALMIHHLPSYNYKLHMKSLISRFFERIQINSADLIITNSRNTEHTIKNMIKKNISVSIVCPAFEFNESLNKKTNNNNTIYLLSVGTVYERKGYEILINAVAKIKTQNFILNIIGDKNWDLKYTKKIEKLISGSNLNGKVILTGRLSEEELNKYYTNTDIYVSSSLWEGFGIAIAEALYNNLPVIALNVGAISELVENGHNGFLVNSNNIEELIEKLELLITNNSLRKIFSSRTRDNLNLDYSWEKAGELFCKALDNLYNDKK